MPTFFLCYPYLLSGYLKLVDEFLAEVITDCGNENQDIAAFVLYLLTDENNTRPQKNLAELAANLGIESVELELVLEIVVKSGLVLEVPATPKRYQLVHDYLVPFIRKWKNVKLLELSEKFQEMKAVIKDVKALNQKAKELVEESEQLVEIANQNSQEVQEESGQLLTTAKQSAKLLTIFLIVNIIISSIILITYLIKCK